MNTLQFYHEIYTPLANEANALGFEDPGSQQEAEMLADEQMADIAAEEAYERHLEDRGYWEARADEDRERTMGIIPFEQAFRESF